MEATPLSKKHQIKSLKSEVKQLSEQVKTLTQAIKTQENKMQESRIKANTLKEVIIEVINGSKREQIGSNLGSVLAKILDN